MKRKPKIIRKFQKLKLSQKIECISALIISLVLIAAASIYGWLYLGNGLETLTKVKAPNSLDIRAGHNEDIENFEMKDIDIEAIKNEGPKCYVFCVITSSQSVNYDIQLAHTTNIPLRYTLYRAEEVNEGSAGIVVDYYSEDEDQHYYYKKSGAALNLVDLNADTSKTSYYGRTLAKDSDGYYNITYDSKAVDGTPEIYAIPRYSQVRNLDTLNENNDFFILELAWDNSSDVPNFNKWNKADNNKETDIIYISASKHTQ